MSYRIIRFYADDRKRRTLQTGVTLAEAREHCADPETDSKTATDTDETGVWFDGYKEE